MFNNCPQWTEYFRSCATLSSAGVVEIIQPTEAVFFSTLEMIRPVLYLSSEMISFRNVMLSIIKDGGIKQRGKAESKEEGATMCMCVFGGRSDSWSVCQVECIIFPPQKQ